MTAKMPTQLVSRWEPCPWVMTHLNDRQHFLKQISSQLETRYCAHL